MMGDIARSKRYCDYGSSRGRGVIVCLGSFFFFFFFFFLELLNRYIALQKNT